MSKPVITSIPCAGTSAVYMGELDAEGIFMSVRAERSRDVVRVHVMRNEMSTAFDLPPDVALALSVSLLAACQAKGATA